MTVRFPNVLLLALALSGLLSASDRAKAEEITLKIDGQGGTMRIQAVTAKVDDVSKVQREGAFGLRSPGSETSQTVLQSLTLQTNESASVSFPQELCTTLYNTLFARNLSALVNHSDGSIIVSFSGGDGERGYFVEFNYNEPKGTIRRSVSRTGFGEWVEIWKLDGARWIQIQKTKSE